MKVLKFGGTSIGTPDSLRQVKNIVSSCDGRVIVVVSAFGGITDSLVKASSLAESGDASFTGILDSIKERHLLMCDELLGSAETVGILKSKINALCDRLTEICRGAYILGVLPRKTRDEILSFGERLSSLIVTEVIPEAAYTIRCSSYVPAAPANRTLRTSGKLSAHTRSVHRI